MDDELLMLLFGQQPLRKDRREYTTFIYYPITDTVTIRLVSELRWKSLEDIISDARSYLRLKREMEAAKNE